jgi:hypothetical protein
MEEFCKIFLGASYVLGIPKLGFSHAAFSGIRPKVKMKNVKIDRKCKHKKNKLPAKVEDPKRL